MNLRRLPQPNRGRRKALLAVLVAAAVIGPIVMWYIYGRKMAVDLLITAERYVAHPGQRLKVSAHVSPQRVASSITWRGPGNLSGLTPDWVAPMQPGTYTIEANVNRSGSRGHDAISIDVVDPKATVAPTRKPPATTPAATPEQCAAFAKARIVLRGKPCVGSSVVAELQDAPPVAIKWEGAAQGRQTMVEFRVPDGSYELHAKTSSCEQPLTLKDQADACQGGPARDRLFADFRAQLIAPNEFRLFAKPPRIKGTKVSYQWTLDGVEQRQTNVPRLVHRFVKARPQHWVRLLITVDGKHASTTRVVADRTFAGPR